MGILSSQQSKGIFRQLADVDGAAGVKTVIENHDAWLRNETVAGEINSVIRLATAGRPRSAAVGRRIAAQSKALASVVTCLPVRLSHAG